jgi:hypothetical protein
MFKILGLLSLSTAYSLSVMYFEGVKLGDLQVSYHCFSHNTKLEAKPATWLKYTSACNTSRASQRVDEFDVIILDNPQTHGQVTWCCYQAGGTHVCEQR